MSQSVKEMDPSFWVSKAANLEGSPCSYIKIHWARICGKHYIPPPTPFWVDSHTLAQGSNTS